jgi:hypothetical protein
MSQPDPPSSPAPARWYHLGSADLVFLVLLFVIVQSAARQIMLDDPGLGWHLRDVDAVLEKGWLTEDPFGLRPGRPWLTNQWLGELPLWLGERWAGLEGIAAVITLVLALALRCLYRMLQRDGLPWPIALLWTALATLATSGAWVARPNVFTLLFVLLTARICEQFHTGRISRAATFWLWPMFVVWANVHGGFVAGLVMLALTLVVEIGIAVGTTDPEQRRAARGRGEQMCLLFLGAIAATLVNPYGYTLYPWIYRLLGDDYFMNLNLDWRSPDFHGAGALRFESLMLLLPLVLGVSRRRPNLVELVLCVFWLHMAFNGIRYIALWVLVAVPLMARCSIEVPWLVEQARRLDLAGEKSLLARRQTGPAPWLWSAVFAVAFLGWARMAEGQFARHNPDYLPARELDQLFPILKDNPHLKPIVFHSINWGGYLTWKGWPSFRTWIDDRNEVQGKDYVEEYRSILNADPDWEKRLDGADVHFVCVPVNEPLTRALSASRRWRRANPEARHVAIFVREPEAGIARLPLGPIA